MPQLLQSTKLRCRLNARRSKIAETLRQSEDFDEIGLIRSQDGTTDLSTFRNGDNVKLTAKAETEFRSLFERLIQNPFTPSSFARHNDWVLARAGDYFPGLLIMNSGPWCGGTDEQWRAQLEEEFSSGVSNGGPVFYAYNGAGAEPQEPCKDDEFLTREYGFCDMRLNEEWLIVFEYFNPQPDGLEGR